VRNTNVAVALLYQTRELERHLRDALSSLGTPIVYEAAADDLDAAALESSGARVVVVNLDPAVESHLDEVYGLLENDRYNVVFNDAQVSSSLSGWDQARWVRHLAAKILGADIDPPRPEGAEAIPAPVVAAPVAEALAIEEVHDAEPEEIELAAEQPARIEAPTRPDVVVSEPPVQAETVVAKQPDAMDMLESAFDAMNQPAAAVYETSAPPSAEEFDFSTLEALTAAPLPPAESEPLMFSPEFLDEAESIGFEEPASPSVAQASPPPPQTETEEFDLSILDELLSDAPAQRAEPEQDISIDAGDLGDLGDLEMLTERSPSVAEHAPSGLSLIDEDVFDEPVAPAPKEAATPMHSSALAAAADWSLEDMLEGEGEPPPVPPANDFGIEKLSAAEYLAPSDENVAPPPVPEHDFEFELMPMEEAVAPQPVQREAHEAWLDPDKISVPMAKIKRVWVLGASIGGPEAVREFLGELPHGYPALFLLAQHMGAEFVDLMAQQLAKSIKLTVRTPTHGERVGHGEVVIVPTTHRLQVDPEGIVVLERVASDSAYSPSIDRVLRDVADRYGANSGAIIFSGMTTDAVEGSTYLSGKGGAVYTQHPDTCVVSSMVDGVIEAGIVKFMGSPKELAERMLADSAGAKR